MLTWNSCQQGNALANDRTYVLPTTDPILSPNQTTVPALATFQLRQRDTLDFSLDLTAWIAANAAGAQIASAVWAVATGSPATPTLVAQEFDPNGLAIVVINDNGNAVGSVFWLDVTVTLTPVVLPGNAALSIPARTLVRRIYVQTVAG